MPRPTELLLLETFGDEGRSARTVLRREDDALVLALDDDEYEIEPKLVFAVFARYAKELDPSVTMPDDADTLALDVTSGSGSRLVRLRHLARFDVIARDYLVLVREGQPALVELATAITAALVHLVSAARSAHSP